MDTSTSVVGVDLVVPEGRRSRGVVLSVAPRPGAVGPREVGTDVHPVLPRSPNGRLRIRVRNRKGIDETPSLLPGPGSRREPHGLSRRCIKRATDPEGPLDPTICRSFVPLQRRMDLYGTGPKVYSESKIWDLSLISSVSIVLEWKTPQNTLNLGPRIQNSDLTPRTPL